MSELWAHLVDLQDHAVEHGRCIERGDKAGAAAAFKASVVAMQRASEAAGETPPAALPIVGRVWPRSANDPGA